MTTPPTTPLPVVLEATGGSIAKDLGAQYEKLHGVEKLDVGGYDVLVVPQGKQVVSVKPYLDAYLTAPERRTGTATLQTEASFIAHVIRHKDADSVIFADRTKPQLLAIFDYHKAGGPGADVARFGGHRAVYPLPLSREWKTWSAAQGKAMSAADFAEFVDANIGDVMSAPDQLPEHLREWSATVGGRFASSTALLALSRNLSVNVETTVKQATTLDTGEIALTYTEQHTDGSGLPVKVANLFLIAIPLFVGGACWQIAVRLRYRLVGGRVQWTYQLHRAAETYDHAFDGVVAAVQAATALPLFHGTPEQ